MKYVPALDGIRAFAVIAVILFHSQVPYFEAGFQGVDIFFVLSGFLITTLLLRERQETGRIRLLAFYLRRALRLYPPLLLLLVLSLIPGQPFYVGFNFLSFKAVAIAGAYLTDFFAAFTDFFSQMPRTKLEHTWSLAMEEHFYILWPFLLLWAVKRFSGSALVAALGILYAAASMWKYGNVWLGAETCKEMYFRFDLHATGLILGALLAALRLQGGKIPGLKYWLPLSAFLLVDFDLLHRRFPEFTGLTWGDLCTLPAELFAFFLIAKITEDENWKGARILGSRVPAYIGRVSYGMYLFSAPLDLAGRLAHIGDYQMVQNMMMTLAGSLMVAALSYHTIERAARGVVRRYHLGHVSRA